MKKITQLAIALFLFAGISNVNAQDECTLKYNFFAGDVQSKKYEDAKAHLMVLLEKCPKLSVSIYQLGDKVAKGLYKKGTNKAEAVALIKKIYEQRLVNFPNKGAAKATSDYASFLAKEKLASKDEVFALLEKAYKMDATKMGVKNIYAYFQGVTDRNKDANPQVVFDTYDDVLETVGKKLADYAAKLKPLLDKKESGQELDKSEAKKLRIYTVNSKALGSVEGQFDRIISEIATCDRLVPLYTRDFEKFKSDGKWLKRAVSRMYNKDCTEDPLYEKLVGAYVAADPSPKASVFYAGILYKNGKESEAMEYYKKAVDQEPDALEKAKNLYKIAQLFAKKGQRSKARNYANQAIQNNPNFGRAYILIANLYAKSANSCGTNVFEKRMVYVAALNKARRAAAVDPSISSKARKYVRSYQANIPSKKLIFQQGIQPGSSHKIGCWIGETVKVPSH